MSVPQVPLNASTRDAVVEDVVEAILRHYLFPEVASEIAGAIRSRASAGEYDQVTTPRALADVLTTYLREASHDHHLCLLYPAPPRPTSGREQPTPEEREERRRRDIQSNFGFYRVERLPGNVGYLDLRRFHAPDRAGEATVAAMRLRRIRDEPPSSGRRLAARHITRTDS
jgi:hypothetical protein